MANSYSQSRGTITVRKNSSSSSTIVAKNESYTQPTSNYIVNTDRVSYVETYTVDLVTNDKDYEVYQLKLEEEGNGSRKKIDTNYIELNVTNYKNIPLDSAELKTAVETRGKYFLSNIWIIHKKTKEIIPLRNSGVKIITKSIPKNFCFYSYKDHQLMTRTD